MAANIVQLNTKSTSIFNKPTKFNEVISEITLAAHTDDEVKTIGSQTPLELARIFAARFSQANKAALKDIYLISCEAGLSKNGAPPLAQKFHNATYWWPCCRNASYPYKCTSSFVPDPSRKMVVLFLYCSIECVHPELGA